MDPEEKNEAHKDFGKVVDALHTKQKLPSLRTYQGDMAEFIKEKNESVVSIALKERKGQEEKQKAEEIKTSTTAEPVRKKGGLRQNLSAIVLSLFLTVLGAAAVYFVFTTLTEEPFRETVIEGKLISYNNLVALSGVTPDSLGAAIADVPPGAGINLIEVTGTNGTSLNSAKVFFEFLGVTLPPTLARTLQEDYAIGTIHENGEPTKFVIITVSDFGRAFSAMLEWEETMERDLSFLTWQPASVSTTTEETVVNEEAPAPADEWPYSWKDIIVRNKDTRGLVNEKGKSKIAYSFLDRNTILIVDDISAVGKLLSAYVSHVVR